MKKISVRDLKIGDKVVGMHREMFAYKVLAGTIISKVVKKGITTYHVQSRSGQYSGDLNEDEIEVIDQATCNTIIKLYDVAIGAGLHWLETVERINEIRHKSAGIGK